MTSARSRPVPLSHGVAVSVAMDRIAAVAHPADGQPSPCARGATPEGWAQAAGLDAVAMEPHETADVARLALRRLVEVVVVEWAGPDQWRPTQRAPRRPQRG